MRRDPRRQPVKDALKARGIEVKAVAAVAGMARSNASDMLWGRVHPSEKLCKAVELLTGLPRTELFEPDVLRIRPPGGWPRQPKNEEGSR